jgi:hypothetical protein
MRVLACAPRSLFPTARTVVRPVIGVLVAARLSQLFVLFVLQGSAVQTQ